MEIDIIGPLACLIGETSDQFLSHTTCQTRTIFKIRALRFRGKIQSIINLNDPILLFLKEERDRLIIINVEKS